MDFHLQSYGERAVFIQKLSGRRQSCVLNALKVSPPHGFVEYVVGYSNVLVILDGVLSAKRFPEWLSAIPEVNQADLLPTRLLEIPVKYSGADLAAVAKMAQLSIDEVVAIHSGADYRVRMMGFAPGFPYLDGLDSRLHFERRASPRNHIVPGSVAIGGRHAGIYSVASPGGWHILGHSEHPLFQPEMAKGPAPDENAVFALAPGDRVKFVAIN